jgi:hypothetical protein
MGFADDKSKDSSPTGTDFPEYLLARLAAAQKPSAAFVDRPTLRAELEPFHPLKSATLVAGLLTEPSVQANTIRIEALIHLLLAFANGTVDPSHRVIRKWLNSELGSTTIALIEDPPEDVFVSNVTSAEGNFRIFEGVWESNDFYLQRVVNVVATLPDNEKTRRLKREILAILKLSEEIAARRRLARFSPGGGNDKQKAQIPSLHQMKSLRSAITFSSADFERQQIMPEDLEPFIFPLEFRTHLGDQALGDSELERRPIIQDGSKWLVLLPTAVSIAIRQHVLSWISRQGYEDSFDRFLTAEYRAFLATTSILGSRIPRGLPLPSKKVGDQILFEVSTDVDAGRYLQVIAIVDGLAAFVKHGFLLPDSDVSQLSEEIRLRVNDTRADFRKQQGFKQGLTLLVWCGYGRPASCRVPAESEDWRIESVSAPDLDTLSSIPHTSHLFLWKLVDHERLLSTNGVLIANANGLLNLYGWWSRTNYMMLDQKMEFGMGKPLNLLIPTDCLREVRTRVRQSCDNHVLPLPSGRMVRVLRKSFDSYFPEDTAKPSYGCIDAAIEGKFLAAYVGKRLVWWVGVDPDRTRLSRDLVYRLWDAVSCWLEKAVPILEEEELQLRNGAVLTDLDFSEAHQTQVEPASEDVLRSCLSVSVKLETRTIQIVFHDPFLGGFGHPKNIGERAILHALTSGVLTLGGRTADEITVQRLLESIVPNEDARHLHFFKAAHFRDYVRDHDRPKSLFIDEADDARCKLGLGWLVRNPNEDNHLTTQGESVRFLNGVVDIIWRRMRPKLQTLNRPSLIEQSLRYIEGVEADRLQWERTIRAVVALRNDKPTAKDIVIREIARFNAATLALRLVVEMAISECPISGGQSAGILDVHPLMSDAFLMFHLGGCSDAIQRGVMEPELQITPNGNILTHAGFQDEIVEPFGRQFATVHLEHETSSYEKHFQTVKAVLSVDETFPEQFLNAVKREFGLSIDELRGFRDALEHFALEQRRCVFVVHRDEIVSYCATSKLTNAKVAKAMLDRFELWPRQSWDSTPRGFRSKDWYPWRFGRRLSLIWRPLVRLEGGENPRYVVSPGLIGTNLIHVLRLYYEGLVPTDQCRTTAMRRWVGEEVNRRGHAFAYKVFEAMQAQSYQVRREVNVSSLLNVKLERDFGDIDVLAWRPGDGTVLTIECKDLRLARTPNEIAEQLNQFTGQLLANGERDDLLKHLDRCDLLKQRSQVLAENIGMKGQDIEVKTVVCFSHPVPMQYVSKRLPDVTFLTIEELKSAGF